MLQTLQPTPHFLFFLHLREQKIFRLFLFLAFFLISQLKNFVLIAEEMFRVI